MRLHLFVSPDCTKPWNGGPEDVDTTRHWSHPDTGRSGGIVDQCVSGVGGHRVGAHELRKGRSTCRFGRDVSLTVGSDVLGCASCGPFHTSCPVSTPLPGSPAVLAEDGHELLGFYGLVVGGALPPSSGSAPVTKAMPADLVVQLSPVTDAVGVTHWPVMTSGATADAVARVILSFVPSVTGIGTVPLTMAGDWQGEAIIRRTGVSDDARVRFAWAVVLPLGA